MRERTRERGSNVEALEIMLTMSSPARKAKMLLHKPRSAKALGNLWLTLFTEVHGPTAKNLTNKQYGSSRRSSWRPPEGKASEILETVIT